MSIRSFGPFSSLSLECSSGLNVLVGSGGSGKTQLLKLLHAVTSAVACGSDDKPCKEDLNPLIGRHLMDEFGVTELGRLASQGKRTRADVTVSYSRLRAVGFGFNGTATDEVRCRRVTSAHPRGSSVFLPSQDRIPDFPAGPARDAAFDPVADTASDIDEGGADALLAPVLEALDGRVVERDGLLCVVDRYERNPIAVDLVGEGRRRLVAVARLITSGTLAQGGTLFWDQPEAGVDLGVLRALARTVLQFAAAGVQVFVATRSLFLLREIELLAAESDDSRPPVEYIGLSGAYSYGGAVEQGPSPAHLGRIDALEQELAQAARYLALR